MIIKGRVKRDLSLILLTVLAVTGITGCGKKDKNEEGAVAKATANVKDYVFASEDFDIEGLESSYINGLELVNGRLYGTTGSYGRGGNKVFSFNTDGTDVKSFDVDSEDHETIYSYAFSSDGSSYAISAIDKEVADKSSDEEGEEGMGAYEVNLENLEYALVKIDTQGHIVNRIPCSEQGEGYNIYSIVPYGDDKIILSSTKGIETYSESEGFKTVIDTVKTKEPYKDCSFYLYEGSDDKIFAQSFVDNKEVVYLFDPKKGEFTKECSALAANLMENGFSLHGGDGYDIYASDENQLYGYDVEKDELTKIMDYVDSGVSPNSGLYNIIALSDSEFIGVISNDYINSRMCRLKKVPADQVKEKKIITIGGYLEDRIRSRVMEFNSSQNEYTVKFVDYSEYSNEENDYAGGQEQFDKDIIGGTAPDVLVFSSGQDVEKYQNKGVLLDMIPYLEKDNIEMLPNVLEALKTGDKLYKIITSYTISCFVMPKDLSEGRAVLTLQEVDDLIKKTNSDYEYAFGMSEKSNILNQGIMYAGDQYIDWENKTCHFDSEEFIRLLEFTNKFPKQCDSNKYGDDYLSLYREGKCIFLNYGAEGFDTYQLMKQGAYGKDVSFVGFPNEDGINETSLEYNGIMGINAKTQNPDAAWEVIKSLLSDDYQTQLNYEFSVTKSGLEAQAQRALERPYKLVDGEKVYEDEFYPIGDEEIKLEPLTKEEVDYVVDFVTSVDKLQYYNYPVFNIIQEEASAYFNGQKSAKEAADIIQSRLTIYVNENS